MEIIIILLKAMYIMISLMLITISIGDPFPFKDIVNQIKKTPLMGILFLLLFSPSIIIGAILDFIDSRRSK